MDQKSKTILSWIIIIILLLAVWFQNYKNGKDKDDLLTSIINYKDTATFERLKNGALISTNTTLQLSSQKQIEAMAANINDTLAQMVKRFKKLTNVTQITNNFITGKDTMKYETKIPCDFKPFKVRMGSDTTYQFVGTIGNDYFSIDSLSIKNKISLVFGRKKVGFMKYENAVDVNNSNSLMITSNIKSYQYVPEKKWYERTWVHILAGAGIQSGIQYCIKAAVK